VIDWAVFVQSWMDGKSMDEIAKDSGCSAANVSIYATRLRKRGVELPRRDRGRGKQIDVAALNDLVKKAATK
jgi:transposase